ncbi:MAG: hypothetical protein K2X87_23665 [Gemmataceae bacterium]|nr:hypothetical protein [Gemmataceae bacterium]
MGIGSLVLWGGMALGQPDGPAEVAPEPRPAAPPVAVAAVPGGYRIALNRRTADRLSDLLAGTDEQAIAAALRDRARAADEKDAATLELIALVATSQLPGFRQALAEKTGPAGAVVTVTGLQAERAKLPFRKPRPRLERAAGLLRENMAVLPADAREAVEALRAVGRTTPLFWKVEPLP